MTRGKGKQILSPSEREGLEEEKRELEVALKDAESGEYGKGTSASVDTAALKRQIARIEQALDDGKAPKVSDRTRDELVKEAEELKERIIQGMPTKYEMDHPAMCPGAVRKHLNWDKRTQKDKARYKQIMNILEPEDPTAADLEKFRKEK
ncbi:MAG: hypothetical protein Q8O36_00515 [Candidatus Omnitrophota bacterium]|nr:hypothetical protein [Candidatus Omnitrophota bacterium]